MVCWLMRCDGKRAIVFSGLQPHAAARVELISVSVSNAVGGQMSRLDSCAFIAY